MQLVKLTQIADIQNPGAHSDVWLDLSFVTDVRDEFWNGEKIGSFLGLSYPSYNSSVVVAEDSGHVAGLINNARQPSLAITTQQLGRSPTLYPDYQFHWTNPITGAAQ